MTRTDKYVKILKRPVGGGENQVYYVTRASLRRVQDEVRRVYQNQENTPYKAPKLASSDNEFEQWKADEDQNLLNEISKDVEEV